MIWLFWFLLQAYIVGFYWVSKRAKTVIREADRVWPEGYEFVKRCTDQHVEGLDLFNMSCGKVNKETWLHYCRNWHITWFVLSPFWSDIVCLINFVKMMIKDVNPKLALVFEQDLSIKSAKNVHKEENIELKERLEEMQKQIQKLSKKTG